MTAQEILAAHRIDLPSVDVGRHYAICPRCSAERRTRAHQTDPCLGITVDDRGVTWGCNHCGWTGGEAFHKTNGHTNGHARASPFEADYDYVDEAGKVLFQVCRKWDKGGFPQRKPDGKGGWTWGTAGVRKVLYRLPEVLEAIASGRPIALVEGEKDANALWTIGIPATCSPGGAAKPGQVAKWRREYSELLRAADLVVLNDNDEAGRAHAEATASTSAGIAKSVRRLDLEKHWPEMPDKADVSDWLAAGHKREELDNLMDFAPEWTPAEQGDDARTTPTEEGEEQPAASLNEWDAGDDTEAPRPREWLLGNIFARRFMSALLGDGGVGKTATRYAQLLSLAIGRSLTGEHVFQRCRVLIISLEDDADELRRRILALLLHYRIARAELKGWLFLAAPGGTRGKLVTTDPKSGAAVRGPLAASLEATIVARGIDIVSVDPFVKSHSVEENSNSGIDDVVQVLTDLATKHNIAVDAPHHTTKGAADPGNADRGRGASAMKDAARLVYTLTPMNTEEAKAFGIAEDKRPFFIRMDSGKVNIAPPMRSAKWFRLVGVRLDNATALYPSGDEVQAVEPWQPPEIWADLDNGTLNAILDTIEAGLKGGARFSDAPKAAERAAWKVVVEHAPAKTEAQARDIIKTWVKNDVLVRKDYNDPEARKERKGLYLNTAKRPGSECAID